MCINYCIDKLNSSKFSIIGFNFRNELKKDELVNKLGFTKINPNQIYSSLRDNKIESILSDVSINGFIIDYDDILSIEVDRIVGPKLVSKLLNCIDYIREKNYKIVICLALHNTYQDNSISFSPNNKLLYRSDFVLNIMDNSYIVVKDRFKYYFSSLL